MRDSIEGLLAFSAPIANLQGHAEAQDLENVMNAIQGVGEVRMQGSDIHIRYDPKYVSEKTLRMQLASAGYPPADA